MIYLKSICCVLLCFCGLHTLQAQDTRKLKKLKPSITGTISASANFYSVSNGSDTTRTRQPFAWNLYGSITPQVGRVSVPLSFVINQYNSNRNGKSFTRPYIQFGMSPTYKRLTLHLGYRSMLLSPLIFEGQSFYGAGVEYTPKHFRFGAFYGRLNKSIREDSINNTPPQFLRLGYGVKIGIGNTNNFFDLIYFHAKDNLSAAPFTDTTKQYIRPQENAVVGSSFRLTIIKKLSLTGDVAVSGLTQDLSLAASKPDSTDKWLTFGSKLIRYNPTSIPSYAGQSGLTLATKYYTGTVGYRRVQPDFRSLGTPYVVNDNEMLSWLNNFNLAGGLVNISTTLGYQHNNLKKRDSITLHTLSGAVNMYTQIGRHMNLSMNYTGYSVEQKDAITGLRRSTPLQQQINQVYITPSWYFTSGSHTHIITANISLSVVKNKTYAIANSNSLSTSVNYNIGFAKKDVNLSLNGLYNQYEQDNNTFTSFGAISGISARLLKSRNLSLQCNAGYLFNRFTQGRAQDNLSFSGNAGYRAQRHSFNVFANYLYTPASTIDNFKIPYAVTTKNIAGGITYNYSF